MEPLGFAIGVASLTGAFTACVDCFEYIQLGRQFGQDYGKCLLKLDIAKVRMSRWGAAMGLGLDTYMKRQVSMSGEDLRLAKSLLEQISDSFKDAKRISERFEKHSILQKTRTDDLLVYDTVPNLNPSYQRLHLTMGELANQRQKKTSIRKKAIWAIYEKKRFDSMIEDVTGFIRELVELVPATQEDQRALCKTEVCAISETQDLALLNDIACEDDNMLAAEVKKEMDNRGHSFTDWKASGSAMMWAGDGNAFGVKSKSHSFARFTVSGNANVHLGNVNRGG